MVKCKYENPIRICNIKGYSGHNCIGYKECRFYQVAKEEFNYKLPTKKEIEMAKKDEINKFVKECKELLGVIKQQCP